MNVDFFFSRANLTRSELIFEKYLYFQENWLTMLLVVNVGMRRVRTQERLSTKIIAISFPRVTVLWLVKYW